MMTLKYPEPVVRPHGQVCREPSLFTLPPQGVATLSETDALALEMFCAAIRDRLWGPVTLTAHPHRIGSRTSVALHLEGRLGRCIDVLITVTGSTLWPLPEEYDHPRWYVTVPDAADVVYLLLHLSDLCERFRVN
ncbi:MULTISPECIES: acetyltransferase [unclassified Serratia (in: enterobacteria)]|uniref:acetyltransferase n=1 Tax=unclassified Serratia (in: enterobacteria) TaxID=2647522 RepID=UPI002ED0A0AC|nr:acetyltransferase [Serratia sp. C2(2)]MEE4449871.1 acetyltransferase [Serratia sp. C2(1)]